MVVSINTTPEFEAGQPERLFPHEDVYDVDFRRFGVDPESERFLLVKKPPDRLNQGTRIIIVENWLDDVARKLAAN
jgi:hypothetical protein